MKGARCQFGVIVFVSLFLALGSVGLGPGNLLNEASFARTVVGTAVTSDVNETIVIMPPPSHFSWGWAGWITFVYWDVALDTGIANATVTCQGWNPELNIFDCNNGSYFLFLNTTESYPKPDPYILILTFEKENYETQVVTYYFRISPVHTEVLIQVPEFNVNGSIFDLIVPIGDSLDLRFFYNDTDSSDGYVGGLSGAYTTATLYGPTLVRKDSTLIDLGNGNYSYLFDTTESWLFEATGGVPIPHELPYYLDVEFWLEGRTRAWATVRIHIVEIPTELEALNFEEERGIDLSYVRISFIASLRFSDVWPGHGSVPISNATVIVENSAPNWVEILGIAPDAQEPGLYNIKFKCIEAFLDQSVSLTITFEKDNYVTQTLLVEIRYDYNIILPPPEPWWWPLARLALLVSFAFAIYHHRRNSQKTDSASAIDDASNYPVPSPHTLEEQGNQDSSAGWYCIYFILAIWIWFNLFRGGMLIQFGALIILTVAAYYYRRIDRRIESASTLVGDSVTPAPAPDTPEEHGNQLSSADWFCIYFILGTWIWFSLFSSGWIQFGAPIILTVAAYYYRRIDRRTESASTLVGDSNTHALSPDTLEDHGNQNSRTESASTLVGDSVTPAPSPDTLEEHGNQDSSACRYSIYFILVMLFGIGWFLFRP